MEFKSFAHLRALYDLEAIVERVAGVKRGGGYICPLPHHAHVNYTPSLGIFLRRDGTQHFKCKGNCGAQGDVIDFIGYLTMGAAYNPKDIEMVRVAIARLTSQPISAPPIHRLKKMKPSLNPVRARLMMKEYQAALQECKPAQEYLERRGILHVAERFGLGYACIPPEKVFMESRQARRITGHYIAIPTTFNGSIIAIKYRRIDTHPEYREVERHALPIRYDSMAGSKKGVFNFDGVAFKPGPVFIPEGEFDAMLLEAHGLRSCCVNAGASSYDSKLELVLSSAFPIIIQDPDEAGKAGASKKLEALGKGIVVQAKTYHDAGALYDHEGSEGLVAWARSILHEQGLEDRHYAASHGAY